MLTRPILERSRPDGRQTSGTASLPAPLKGWNTRDPLAQMDPLCAPVLDNWIPREYSMELRGGTVLVASGMGATLGSFLVYKGVTGTQELYAVSNTDIWDVLAGPAVSVVAGLGGGGDQWQYINFSTTGGNYLYAAGAGNTPYIYDGATWQAVTGVSVPFAITGITTTSLFAPNVYKRRIWFLESSARNAWYLPINAVGGAATQFPLGPLFKDGGELIAQGTWTIDGGNGPDDYLVFLTSEGQVAVYNFVDPASPVLKGVWTVPKPIGRRCLQNFGGDMLVLTEQGVYPLSKVVGSAVLSRRATVTDRIAPSFKDAANLFPTSQRWSMTVHSSENLLVVNVPASIGTYQYVMSTITGAWCRFVGLDGVAFDVFDRDLYFIKSGSVYKALSGTADLGANIVGQCQQAFNYIGPQSDVREKHIKLIRPLLVVDNPVQIYMALAMDFDQSPVFQYASLEELLTMLGSSVWDTALWDAGTWGFSDFVAKEWKTIFALPGFCASVGVRVMTKTARVKWTATDVLYEMGFVL